MKKQSTSECIMHALHKDADMHAGSVMTVWVGVATACL